ncbi:MAG: glycogen debranching N-terminal domain-containing protein, partial [Rhodoglobus sp.]
MTETLQPFLHDQEVVLAAPSQCWFSADGRIGDRPIQGLYVSDVRVISAVRYAIGGQQGEHIATSRPSARQVQIEHLHRNLDGPGADPDVSSRLERSARPDGLDDALTLVSRHPTPLVTTIVATIGVDATPMDAVKAGLPAALALALTASELSAEWTNGPVSARLAAPDAQVVVVQDAIELRWSVTVPARGSITVRWSVTAADEQAVVHGVVGEPEWSGVRVEAHDRRLERWLATSLDDLSAVRLTTVHAPGEEFLAAGAPWFFTLFGRDSIWAARMMLPLGTRLAASTLRALAALQGSQLNPAIAEAPGKIMHELRRAPLSLPGEGVTLPPLYYGTHDATPLWICLLHDAWRWGMPEPEVEHLLPALERALGWMRDFGDADGDGLLEYIDETKRGLANQGWKDSGDSIQFADGTLAAGPIALVEVQAYAYEAAMHGADLLDHFGREGGADWREWAARLREVFHAAFWLEDAHGAYLAIALDAAKRPVDSVTSNAGHVLGTGILSADQAERVGARLVMDDLSSGYGLRTMSTTAAGYWPLGYHSGSVWTHDTAIAVTGLTREGLTDYADTLIAGLLNAAEGFHY